MGQAIPDGTKSEQKPSPEEGNPQGKRGLVGVEKVSI